ncbi:hypothetical protein HK105_206601 [Polyrhizophydium stewartii]|uniref:Brl1/Brr6 domain-containing protein n=1 Tax=Polyrhizophydium stewartii TaxID=2732419 RepID=A0ABR4N2Y0_9FUNG|nr:hypothetical protein HK105_005151 [Polyrhizophydium stewartii]
MDFEMHGNLAPAEGRTWLLALSRLAGMSGPPAAAAAAHDKPDAKPQLPPAESVFASPAAAPAAAAAAQRYAAPVHGASQTFYPRGQHQQHPYQQQHVDSGLFSEEAPKPFGHTRAGDLFTTIPGSPDPPTAGVYRFNSKAALAVGRTGSGVGVGLRGSALVAESPSELSFPASVRADAARGAETPGPSTPSPIGRVRPSSAASSADGVAGAAGSGAAETLRSRLAGLVGGLAAGAGDDSERKLRSRKRKKTDALVALGGVQGHGVSDGDEASGDDDDVLIEESTRWRPSLFRPSAGRTGAAGAPGSTGISHLHLPYLITGYIQVFFTAFIVAIVSYIVIQFIASVRHDLKMKADEFSQEISNQIAECTKSYFENRCTPGQRVPAVEKLCVEWETCMSRDPKEIGRLKVGAETLAEILNKLIDPLSYKTMIFGSLTLFGTLMLTSSALGFLRRRGAHSEPAAVHHHHHPPAAPSVAMPDALGLRGGADGMVGAYAPGGSGPRIRSRRSQQFMN